MTQTIFESEDDESKLAQKLLNNESQVLNAINVRPAGIDLRVICWYLACLHHFVGANKPDGCDKDIVYYEKAKELMREIDGVSGLLEYALLANSS